jgi:hypothetical protein
MVGTSYTIPDYGLNFSNIPYTYGLMSNRVGSSLYSVMVLANIFKLEVERRKALAMTQCMKNVIL